MAANIIQNLKANLDKVNIADGLDKDYLRALGQECVRNFETDKLAMSVWEQQVGDALKLAQQIKEKKSTPWEDAANVKFPLMTVAAIQFAARAYPEIVKANNVVKCKVTGKDPDNQKELKASRISAHMNYQLTDEMKEWESDTDQLLHILPVIGMVWRKTYFSPEKGRNVSELVLPTDCYINHKARTEDTARRITHRYWLYENDIWERQKGGQWLEIELPQAKAEDGTLDETDVPHEFLEQHRFYDLDDDGYAEPYIVTVHRETSQVVRIVARYEEKGIKEKNGKLLKIEPTNYFVLFPFLPNPDGSIFALGFGQLLEPINETINTLINQLIDAGTMSNAGGGFIGRGIKIKGGVVAFKPNEWKMVETQGQDLNKNIVPLPVREPSAVLFQLLGFLTQGAKDITSVQDIIGGDVKLAANMPATTMMALIEQGMKVYVAIYKRIYRSLTKEFNNLFKLNAKFLDKDKYMQVIGEKWEPPKNQMPTTPGLPQAMPPGMGGPGMPMLPPQGQPGLPPELLSGNPGENTPPPDQMGMAGLMGGMMPMGMMPPQFDDYNADDIDVLPVADPNMSTEMQRMAKIQAVMQFVQMPGINLVEVVREAVRSINPLNQDKILLTDGQLMGQEPINWKPPPSPQVIIAQAKMADVQAKGQESQIRLKMDMDKYQMEMQALEAQIAKTKADTMLAMAKAQSELDEDSLNAYKHEMDTMTKELEMKVNFVKEQMAQQHQMQMAQGQQQQGMAAQNQAAQMAMMKAKGAQGGGQLPVKKG